MIFKEYYSRYFNLNVDGVRTKDRSAEDSEDSMLNLAQMRETTTISLMQLCDSASR